MVNLIHDITQYGYKVNFSPDFSGMITITYIKDGIKGDEYIRHEHVSYPGSTEKELLVAVNKSLIKFLEEAKTGQVKKDGLWSIFYQKC